MKQLILSVVAVAAIGIPAANAAPATAKPDPALVQRYTDSVADRDAKLAECKRRNDLVKILTDVECVSADEAYKASQRKADQAKQGKR
jgi:Ni/Co efflux regulator RcnB